MTIDPATLLALIKTGEDIAVSIANIIAAAKEQGDPLPQDITDQLARNKATNDRLHALADA